MMRFATPRVISSLADHRELLRVFTASTLSKSTEGTKLGIIWWFADPLLMTAVYVLLIELLRGGGPTPAFPLFVMTGLVAWKATATSFTTATTKIITSERLIKSYAFPTIILPVSVVLANFVLFLASLPLVIVAAVLYRYAIGETSVAIGAWALLSPVVVAVHLLLTAGLTILLTCLGVFFNDVSKLIGHLMRIMWYLSAGLYSLDWAIPGYTSLWELNELTTRHLLLLNPAVYLLDAYRNVLIYNRPPDAIGLLIVAGLAVVAIVLGDWIYHRYEARFAKII